MRTQAIFFDLDGTLVDTAPDLGGAANFIRSTLGLSPLPLADYRRQLDIVLGGTFIMSSLVARSMIERQIRGSIITVLSTAAWQGQWMITCENCFRTFRVG